MAKYRYSRVTAIFGGGLWKVEWKVERKLLGFWVDDEAFDSEEDMMDYVEQLKKAGNIVRKY